MTSKKVLSKNNLDEVKKYFTYNLTIYHMANNSHHEDIILNIPASLITAHLSVCHTGYKRRAALYGGYQAYKKDIIQSG